MTCLAVFFAFHRSVLATVSSAVAKSNSKYDLYLFVLFGLLVISFRFKKINCLKSLLNKVSRKNRDKVWAPKNCKVSYIGSFYSFSILYTLKIELSLRI